MSIENLLNKKSEELDSGKLHEKATQEHQEARKVRKMKPLVEAANELKQSYITEPSYQWQTSDRMVYLQSIMSVFYDNRVSLRLPLFSFPGSGFQYKFDASSIEYSFDSAQDIFVIRLTGGGRTWELQKDTCDEMLDHFIEQVAQIRVNHDSHSGQFWKAGKCAHCSQTSKLYYVAEGTPADLSPDKFMSWNARVRWICDPCLVTKTGKAYVKISTAKAESVAAKDVPNGNL